MAHNLPPCGEGGRGRVKEVTALRPPKYLSHLVVGGVCALLMFVLCEPRMGPAPRASAPLVLNPMTVSGSRPDQVLAQYGCPQCSLLLWDPYRRWGLYGCLAEPGRPITREEPVTFRCQPLLVHEDGHVAFLTFP